MLRGAVMWAVSAVSGIFPGLRALGGQFVPHLAHGADGVPGVAQLLAQGPHVHVNGAAFQQVVGIPHGFHDALAGQNFFGMLQKEMQQRIFLKGQLHRLTVHRNGAGNVIQRDVSKPQGGGAGWCGAGAAQHRLDAADELGLQR